MLEAAEAMGTAAAAAAEGEREAAAAAEGERCCEVSCSGGAGKGEQAPEPRWWSGSRERSQSRRVLWKVWT